MTVQTICDTWNALYARIAPILIAVRSIVHGLPLFVASRPKTPLRALCIIAFDTLYRLRKLKPLPKVKLKMLAALLDFGACANAAFDHKDCCPHEYRRTRQLLEEAGIGSSVVEYLRRLSDLESERPVVGGDYRQFQKVRMYREAVVRLSLGIVATTAHGNQSLAEGIRATYGDADLNILFRMAMQCQIIDDVLDFAKDVSSGLPSFLTASESLSQAIEFTRLAALGYADDRDLPQTGGVFPLRAALFLVSACTKLVIVLGRWRQRTGLGPQFAEPGFGPRLLAAAGVDKSGSSMRLW